MTPRISVIIPVFNRYKELLQSLISIQNQTYRPLEVIIVDDGSTEAVEKFQDKIQSLIDHIPLQIVTQKNKGAPAARNYGFTLSSGEFVLFWDADVIANEDMIEKMYQALQNNPQASFAYSNHIHAQKIKFRAQKFNIEELKKNNYIHTTSLIRRSDFPLFDESLKRFQDWDLFLTMAEQGNVGVWIDEYLYQSLPTTSGISYWLPKIAYTSPYKYLPFFYKKVKKYEQAKEIIFQKHHL